MAPLDRPGLIEQLDRLGAADDATALAAARELKRRMGEVSVTWGEVLRTESDPVFGGTGEPVLADADDAPATADAAPPPSQADALRMIDRILARQSISSTLREDLVEMKRGMAEGSFDDDDARYLRALAKRLGA
jgi:hypothetical protein